MSELMNEPEAGTELHPFNVLDLPSVLDRVRGPIKLQLGDDVLDIVKGWRRWGGSSVDVLLTDDRTMSLDGSVMVEFIGPVDVLDAALNPVRPDSRRHRASPAGVDIAERNDPSGRHGTHCLAQDDRPLVRRSRQGVRSRRRAPRRHLLRPHVRRHRPRTPRRPAPHQAWAGQGSTPGPVVPTW